MSSFLASWIVAFVFTQCVEIGVYVHAHDRPRPLEERLAIAFACSAITHPLVWFVIPELSHALGVRGWWTIVAICESFAVLGETAFLACFGVRRPWAWALGANAASFTMGLVGYDLLAWTRQIQQWFQ